jgi:peptidyl-prolyl cis-trans isomerase C
MKYRPGLLASTGLISLVLLAGCNDKSNTAEAPAEAPATQASIEDENVLATVDGNPITQQDMITFMQLKQQTQPGTMMNPGLMLNEMINTRLLVAEAEANGIQDTEEVVRLLRIQRAATLVSALIRDFVDGIELSDADLQAEYDAQIAGIDKMEYKARHILVENEDEAKDIITKVKPDASNFADLAKEFSTGPSGKDGGDLGWFNASSMVPEFSDAVKAMNKGDVSKAPVQSEFGWHVIYLEDTREIQLPTFEESKERLELIVTQKKLQEHIAELREKADIQVKGQEAPEPVVPLESDQPISTN